MRKQILCLFGLACLACIVVLPSAAEVKPNIVLIVADDLGYGDLGCYGNKRIKTPNIDRLAAAGLRFTDFHSSGPMCSATRAGMLTGRYQQRFGAHFDGALSGVASVPGEGLPLAAVTIAEVLKKQGYATGIFGKWHLGYAPPLTPVNQGFDEFRGLVSGDGDHHTRFDRAGKADWWRNDTLEPEEGYDANLLTRYSVDFIERHRNEPFFLYVPHLAIHFPWQGPEDPPHRKEGIDYAQDKWGVIPDHDNVLPHVGAMLDAMDQSVGAIAAALKQHGLEGTTLVIFTSDNGGYLQYDNVFHNISSNGPLRGQKGDLFEGGHRVPFIASWPGKIRAGETGEVGHSTDLFPTFAALAGISLEGLEFDGVDLSSLLFDGVDLPERMLFWRKADLGAVRSGSWKLDITSEGAQLFDLDKDVGESRDLASQLPEQVKVLRSAWDAWEAEVTRSAAAFK